MSFEHLLAQRTHRMGASAIRELLKVVSQPGMISLAGGIPAPESFPMDIISELTTKVINKYASGAFQYDRTEGFMPLCDALTGYLKTMGIYAEAEHICTTCGSQGALDSIGKILITRGDRVAVEAPTYVGAIQAFNPYEPEYVAMETDHDGLIPESLEFILRTQDVKFVYLIPTFQNPTGRTIPLERRKQIAKIIQTYGALLVEDDPYSALRYRGESIPPIKVYAPDHVVYTGTFSKVFAPGLRVGFFVAPSVITQWMVLAKQGIDLHTSTFNQALAAEYLEGGFLDRQIPRIIALYRPKMDAMLSALQEYFPDGFTWSKPEGGMFVWVEGPETFNMEKVYPKAIQRKTAFVPGKYFYTSKGNGLETMRLNFTMSDADRIDQAIKILSEVIQETLEH